MKRTVIYNRRHTLLALVLLGLAVGSSAEPSTGWMSLARGLDLKWVIARKPSPVGDSRIAVVRVDPAKWQLDLVGRSRTSEPVSRTAREWAKAHKLVVAINAGMFATDYKTHVGYMEYRGHVNSGGVNGYQSVAAFDPRNSRKHPPFRIFDLDEEGASLKGIRKDYASVVQNLRLIQRPGINRWSQQAKKWSEAALGEDAEGRILFVFSRSPFSMYDLNEELLSAGIDLVAAQHLEGGPEAQLYVKVGNFELELIGNYETSYAEDEGNTTAWAIPNVLGVKRKMTSR